MASDGNITNELYATTLARAKEADKLEKENDKLLAQIEKLTEEKAAAKEMAGDLARQKKDVEFSRDKEIEAKKTALAQVTDLQKQLEEAQAELRKTEEARTAVCKEIDKLKTDLIASRREAEMVQQGIPQEAAKEFVAKWVTASDEQFASIVQPFIEIEKIKSANSELEKSNKKTIASANVFDKVTPVESGEEKARAVAHKGGSSIASLMAIPKVKR